MNTEIREDFGTVYVPAINEDFNCYKAIEKFMAENDYNTEYCDICSVEKETSNDEINVKFKFVHYSVRTMATEPYYKIKFKQQED